MDLIVLGRTIQALREEKNMSQEQLANAIGCSQATISNYEKGKRRIYLSHIERMAEALNTPTSTFLEAGERSDEGSRQQPGDNRLTDLIQSLYQLDTSQLDELSNFMGYLLWKQENGGTGNEF